MRPLLPLLALMSASAFAVDLTFYVGTSGATSQGILRATIDAESGKLSTPVVIADAKGPSYLALSADGRTLYATAEVAGGGVAAYRLTPAGPATLLNGEDTKGKGATHVSVDQTGKFLFAANYGSGSVACLPIKADGSLAAATSFLQHEGGGPNKGRQAGPHAHGIYPDAANRFVYVPDLGTDDVFIYQFDATKGLLAPTAAKSGRVTPGSGPRHLAFHPQGGFAYVCNEMAMTVSVFTVDASTGAMKEIQVLPTLPTGADAKGASTAEIFCLPNARALYVSNRGHNSLAAFAIGTDGKLTSLGHTLDVPAVPRGFGLSPDGRWLVCAGQKSGTLNAYRVDLATGKLTDTKQSVPAGAACCIVFAR
ncbi:6-phosphogluconolactonase [Verrucomicrobiota bacterium]|nr:6-phosphogluconolactonase [Verrucomicrobiota bacterium]